MKEAVADHARNLKRDRLLSEKERERLVDRKDKAKLAINDGRVRKKLSNWLKTLDEVLLIFNRLPEEQSRNVITNENAFKLLCLAARAMIVKGFYPIDGSVKDPYTWNTDESRCESINSKKCNAGLYKAKFGNFLAPSRGGFLRFDKQLLNIMQTGAVINIVALVKGLDIDPNDSEAVKIVLRQIDTLEFAGFLERTGDGWRWTTPSDSKSKEKSEVVAKDKG